MKKLILATLAIAGAVTSWADVPILCGHRGSLYGVESSVESFTNGAKRGYQYLETDVKVTKDKQYVCSHDDDLTRLGGTLTIASSNLADLQAETLTQTRSGVKYTGRLCSMQEYLDICKEYDVRPLIELKWATGINSNDCSGIPALIKFIENNGFRNKCIILTSMKPCLEYIRKNYPDVELQFLTGQYWASHFDWCVEWGIDADIQAGYFDKATVKKYHAEGLKVGMWTTNTTDGYKTYGNMGCDFITTDDLDPTNLPELDQDVITPPNTVDYPDLDATVKGSYNPEPVCEFDAPEVANVARAKMRGGIWHLLSADGKSISLLDAATGQVTGTMSMAGIAGTIGDIAYTADGVLLGSEVAADVPFAGGGDVYHIYAWDNDNAAPRLLLSVDNAAQLGNWNNATAGERLAVSGRSNDLKLYISTRSKSGSTYRIEGIALKNGAIDKAVYCVGTDYTKANWGDWQMVIAPDSRDALLIESPTAAATVYSFNWGDSKLPMDAIGSFSAAKTVGMSFHRRANKVYALVPVTDGNAANMSASLYDYTEGIDAVNAVSPAFPESLGANPATLTATAFETKNEGTYMHLLALGQGMTTYQLMADGGEVVERDLALRLEREWINSTTTGNAPEHIDGTNAQQGTAVNGIFYVNDCVDKKIYMFDKTGCIGSVEGGAGWGCARDDAGNIVVRDDKATGTEHSFIVYPAGLTPSNVTTPVRFTVTVPLDGQTNFINAGGDLLGGMGHIYLFPNKQTAINIITVQKGAVTGTAKRTDLQLTGSTAGYVIPVDDDTENFIYQVRATGLYWYNAGTNNDLSTSRASTTAPARNSTGGGAYFTMGGNDIFVHNSGANYKGGFTVRNHTKDDAVITSVDPIGTLGYETGGNYSTFNWMFAEKVNDGKYTLYQYCPANGMAVYNLIDDNYDAGIGDITVDTPTADAAPVYYNLQGVRIAHPAKGQIIIERRGTSTRKLIVR